MKVAKECVVLAFLMVAGTMLTGCQTTPVEPENKVTVVANITAKEGNADRVKTELIKLIAPTHSEAGCINYDLHQDTKNPAHFLFFENWESPVLLQKHLESQHLKDYAAATEGAVELFTVAKMTEIDTDPKAVDLSKSRLTIVADIIVKEDKVDLVKAELRKLIPITRAEEGCVNYDLHQDNENPANFLFYENWESRELWQKHMGAQHLKDYMAATEGMIAGFSIYEMVPVK